VKNFRVRRRRNYKRLDLFHRYEKSPKTRKAFVASQKKKKKDENLTSA